MKICSLGPYQTGQLLKLSTKEMRVALVTPDNTPEKKQALPIKQEDWFKLLDSLHIYNTNVIKKLTARESKSYTIHFSTWRLLLQSFGIVEPLKLKIKQ